MKPITDSSFSPFDATAYSGNETGLASLLLSARRLLVFVLLLILFMGAARPVFDPDFWWHLKTGQLIFETRTIPHADSFSFTARGAEWVTHEWLTELVMYRS